MAARTIRLEQAIFTSVRTPMGEGYRIIAASRGLDAHERQIITRNSPSHDALCGPVEDADTQNGVRGAAFYPLGNERLCLAVSGWAGAEHTGRGGQRVYTHNVILTKPDFGDCGYNPFAVLRAMVEEGLTTPQLKPPPVLPELALALSASSLAVAGKTMDAAFGPAWRPYVLRALLQEKRVIVNLPKGWLDTAEALLMGVPGPVREGLSFSAGLRFSVGRCHHLSLLLDDHGLTKTRSAGQGVEYVDPTGGNEPPVPGTVESASSDESDAWMTLVERHWQSRDTQKLAHRTSKAFADAGEGGRERVGRLYNQIDDIPNTAPDTLLTLVGSHLQEPDCKVEAEIAAEFVTGTQRALLERMNRMSWDEAARFWKKLGDLWRHSVEGCLFAEPLIERALTLAGRVHPIMAAEAALALLQDLSPADSRRDAVWQEPVIKHLAEWAQQTTDEELDRARDLCERWRAVRPTCSLLERIQERCAVAATGSPATR